MNKLTHGFTLASQGFSYLKSNPKLRKFVMIPLIIDFALVVAVFFGGMSWILTQIDTLVTKFFGSDPSSWINVLYIPVVLILGLGFFALAIYVAYILAAVIAAPFNSLLAEKVLINEGAIFTERAWSEWPGYILKSILISLKKVFVFAIIALFILVLSFIPGLNLVATFLTCLVISYDALDLSLELSDRGVGDRLRYAIDRPQQMIGSGSFLFLTVFIPGLTLLIQPFLVIGAAKSFQQGEGRGTRANSSENLPKL